MASDGETSCVSDPNFAVICSFFENFGTQLGLKCPDFLELQEMLDNTQELAPDLLDLHLKLLRKVKKSVSTERWEKALVKVCHTFSSQDAWEVERFGYKKARTSSKVRILKSLLEMQFDLNVKFKGEVNKLTSKELRSEPIGKDKNGNCYWYLIDDQCQIRVYREDPDEETWTLVAKDREELVELIKQLSSGEIDCKDLDSNLNEDSNSLEIEKPITDTGQASTTTVEEDESSVSVDEIKDPNTIPHNIDNNVAKEETISSKEESTSSKEENTSIKEESTSSKEELLKEESTSVKDESTDSKESEVKIISENSETIQDKADLLPQKQPEIQKIRLSVKNFNKINEEVGLCLPTANPKPNDVMDLTSKKKKSINDLAADLRIKTQDKDLRNILEERGVQLSIVKPKQINQPVKSFTSNIKLPEYEDCEDDDDDDDDFDDSDEINLPSHMKQPRLDRPKLLGNKNLNKPSTDEEDEEYDDEIKEPVMYFHGEGSGNDCNGENIKTTDSDYGEAIEEDVMFIYGEGSGYDCETGNEEKPEEKTEKDDKTSTTDSKEDILMSPTNKIGKVVFDSDNKVQKNDKSPKKLSRWDVKSETSDSKSEDIIDINDKTNNESMTSLCAGKVKSLISRWEDISTPTTVSPATNETDTSAPKKMFFFGPQSMKFSSCSTFFKSLQSNSSSNDLTNEVPTVTNKAEILIDNKESGTNNTNSEFILESVDNKEDIRIDDKAQNLVLSNEVASNLKQDLPDTTSDNVLSLKVTKNDTSEVTTTSTELDISDVTNNDNKADDKIDSSTDALLLDIEKLCADESGDGTILTKKQDSGSLSNDKLFDELETFTKDVPETTHQKTEDKVYEKSEHVAVDDNQKDTTEDDDETEKDSRSRHDERGEESREISGQQEESKTVLSGDKKLSGDGDKKSDGDIGDSKSGSDVGDKNSSDVDIGKIDDENKETDNADIKETDDIDVIKDKIPKEISESSSKDEMNLHPTPDEKQSSQKVPQSDLKTSDTETLTTESKTHVSDLKDHDKNLASSEIKIDSSDAAIQNKEPIEISSSVKLEENKIETASPDVRRNKQIPDMKSEETSDSIKIVEKVQNEVESVDIPDTTSIKSFTIESIQNKEFSDTSSMISSETVQNLETPDSSTLKSSCSESMEFSDVSSTKTVEQNKIDSTDISDIKEPSEEIIESRADATETSEASSTIESLNGTIIKSTDSEISDKKRSLVDDEEMVQNQIEPTDVKVQSEKSIHQATEENSLLTESSSLNESQNDEIKESIQEITSSVLDSETAEKNESNEEETEIKSIETTDILRGTIKNLESENKSVVSEVMVDTSESDRKEVSVKDSESIGDEEVSAKESEVEIIEDLKETEMEVSEDIKVEDTVTSSVSTNEFKQVTKNIEDEISAKESETSVKESNSIEDKEDPVRDSDNIEDKEVSAKAYESIEDKIEVSEKDSDSIEDEVSVRNSESIEDKEVSVKDSEKVEEKIENENKTAEDSDVSKDREIESAGFDASVELKNLQKIEPTENVEALVESDLEKNSTEPTESEKEIVQVEKVESKEVSVDSSEDLSKISVDLQSETIEEKENTPRDSSDNSVNSAEIIDESKEFETFESKKSPSDLSKMVEIKEETSMKTEDLAKDELQVENQTKKLKNKEIKMDTEELSDIKDAIADKVNDVKNKIIEGVNEVVENIEDAKNATKDVGDDLEEAIKNDVDENTAKEDIKDAIREAAKEIVNETIEDAVKDANDAIKETVGDTAKENIKDTTEAVKEHFEDATKEIIGDAPKEINVTAEKILGFSASIEVSPDLVENEVQIQDKEILPNICEENKEKNVLDKKELPAEEKLKVVESEKIDIEKIAELKESDKIDESKKSEKTDESKDSSKIVSKVSSVDLVVNEESNSSTEKLVIEEKLSTDGINEGSSTTHVSPSMSDGPILCDDNTSNEANSISIDGELNNDQSSRDEAPIKDNDENKIDIEMTTENKENVMPVPEAKTEEEPVNESVRAFASVKEDVTLINTSKKHEEGTSELLKQVISIEEINDDNIEGDALPEQISIEISEDDETETKSVPEIKINENETISIEEIPAQSNIPPEMILDVKSPNVETPSDICSPKKADDEKSNYRKDDENDTEDVIEIGDVVVEKEVKKDIVEKENDGKRLENEVDVTKDKIEKVTVINEMKETVDNEVKEDVLDNDRNDLIENEVEKIVLKKDVSKVVDNEIKKDMLENEVTKVVSEKEMIVLECNAQKREVLENKLQKEVLENKVSKILEMELKKDEEMEMEMKKDEMESNQATPDKVSTNSDMSDGKEMNSKSEISFDGDSMSDMKSMYETCSEMSYQSAHSNVEKFSETKSNVEGTKSKSSEPSIIADSVTDTKLTSNSEKNVSIKEKIDSIKETTESKKFKITQEHSANLNSQVDITGQLSGSDKNKNIFVVDDTVSNTNTDTPPEINKISDSTKIIEDSSKQNISTDIATDHKKDIKSNQVVQEILETKHFDSKIEVNLLLKETITGKKKITGKSEIDSVINKKEMPDVIISNKIDTNPEEHKKKKDETNKMKIQKDKETDKVDKMSRGNEYISGGKETSEDKNLSRDVTVKEKIFDNKQIVMSEDEEKVQKDKEKILQEKQISEEKEKVSEEKEKISADIEKVSEDKETNPKDQVLEEKEKISEDILISEDDEASSKRKRRQSKDKKQTSEDTELPESKSIKKDSNNDKNPTKEIRVVLEKDDEISLKSINRNKEIESEKNKTKEKEEIKTEIVLRSTRRSARLELTPGYEKPGPKCSKKKKPPKEEVKEKSVEKEIEPKEDQEQEKELVIDLEEKSEKEEVKEQITPRMTRSRGVAHVPKVEVPKKVKTPKSEPKTKEKIEEVIIIEEEKPVRSTRSKTRNQPEEKPKPLSKKATKKNEKPKPEEIPKKSDKDESKKEEVDSSKKEEAEFSDSDDGFMGIDNIDYGGDDSDVPDETEPIKKTDDVKSEDDKPKLAIVDIKKLQTKDEEDEKSKKKDEDSPILINDDSNDIINISETDPLASEAEQEKEMKKPKFTSISSISFDTEEVDTSNIFEPIRRSLRRRQIEISPVVETNRKRARESQENETDAKKRKMKGKRSIDANLRKSIEEQKNKENVSSDDEEQKEHDKSKDDKTDDKIKVPKGKNKKKLRGAVALAVAAAMAKANKSLDNSTIIIDDDSPAKEDSTVKDKNSTNQDSPAPSSDPETSRTSTTATPTSVSKTQIRKKRFLGLELDPGAIIPEQEAESGRNVRQSRRIAQIKIKEEAERRKLEEFTAIDIKSQKKKKSKKDEDRDFKYEKKKKSKYQQVEEDEEESEEEVTTKKKHKKKRKPEDLKRLFNISNAWKSSSDSSSSNEEEEEEEEVEEYISEDERKDVFKSDHEFSPESDIEDNTEVQPTRRARTVKKESDTEEPADDQACQKCGKSDHPEFILLCDTCDNGWHCSCLRPSLFVIPEGDWFCPPCQHISLITSLKSQLIEYDRAVHKMEMEQRRKERLAYVGISLDNVLPSKGEHHAEKKEKKHESESESESGSSDSGSSSGSDSEPIYQLRERRQAHSYRFNDYDDLINSAIQDEVEIKGAGNQGRGKDISTIVNAEKEEQAKALLEAQQQQHEEQQPQLENRPQELQSEEQPAPAKEELEPEELPPVVPVNTNIYEPKEVYSDDDPPVVSREKLKGRKKHRRLNCLDDESEDDAESDEDFKGDSNSEEEEFEEDLGSEDSDDSFGGRRRGLGTRRSTRTRTTRYDREFINDDSDDEPRKKKYRSIWDEESGSESDKSWGKRKNKRSKREAIFPVKKRKKSKKKKKRGSDSDTEVKPKVKRPRIQYGGLDDSEDEVLTRRTRGKKITYVDTLGSDSEEEKPKKSSRIIESEDEYVANDEDDDDELEAEAEMERETAVIEDKEDSGGESGENKPPVVPKKIIKLPKLAKIPKSPRARGRGRGIGVLQRQRIISNITISSIKPPPTVLDPDIPAGAEPEHDDDEDIDEESEEEEEEEEPPMEEMDEEPLNVPEAVPHTDIPVIAANPEDLNEEEVGMMMEEEEFANKQLELMAIQLAKEKKKKELEAQQKMEVIEPVAPPTLDAQPKKRGRRKKFVEGTSPLKQQLQQNLTVPPMIISKVLLNPPVYNKDVVEQNNPSVDPNFIQIPEYPSVPTTVQDLSLTSPPKRRGRGKGKKTLAAEQAAAAAGSTPNQLTRSTSESPSISGDSQPTNSPEPNFHSGKLGIATPPQPFTQNQPTPSVITRMLQSQPVSAQPFATAASAMNQKYFGGMEQPRGASNQFPGLAARGRVPSPYRQNVHGVNNFPNVRPMAPGSPHRLRSPGPPNLPQMFHSPHHPLDPSPSGGGHIQNPRDRQSPADANKGGPTPPPPPAQYARGIMPGMNRFPNPNEPPPGPSAPPVRPPAHHMPFPTQMQPESPPRPPASNAGGGNFSPYHPPPPPNYHYGAYPPPPSLTAADDALPPTQYQSSPYPEHYNPSDSVGVSQPSEGSNSKTFDEEGSGEFGGLVSYFSSQREDDLDA